jgi:F-type H+-transporting ATPase subunit delta
MRASPVARRYAAALIEEAVATETLSRIDGDMTLVRESLLDARELERFFRSPIVSRSKKVAVLDRLFAPRVSELTLRFLNLLVEKGREGLISEVASAYREVRDEQENIVEAHTRIAIPLTADEEKALQETLERRTGKQIRLLMEEDRDLIGGLVVRIGDTVLDGSIRHKLEALKAQLEEGSFLSN